jgi:predicted O-linked N-acetylglucosamine transferase (SPINDLY family)
VELARNPARIAAYRATLRDRLTNSPLMDGKSFAATVETAYFDMWRHAIERQDSPVAIAG